jgi:hypothetical protein
MVTTGSSRAVGIRDDLLVVRRGMEDPPPKLAWPGEDVEVEEYTSPLPHETKTISMRFVGRGPVGMVREIVQPWQRTRQGLCHVSTFALL